MGKPRMERISKHLVYAEYNKEDEELEVLEFDALERKEMKNILFPHTSDGLILRLNNCASIEEVLDLFNSNQQFFNAEHFTQVIMVLRDIQIISKLYNQCNHKTFGEKLLKNDHFIKLYQAIDQHLDKFDQTLLGHLLFNLNRLGVPMEHEFMQKLAMKLRDSLKNSFNISNCAQLFSAVFTENSVRPYYIVLDLIPKVTSYIGK